MRETSCFSTEVRILCIQADRALLLVQIDRFYAHQLPVRANRTKNRTTMIGGHHQRPLTEQSRSNSTGTVSSSDGGLITTHVFKLSWQDIHEWTKELEGKRDMSIENHHLEERGLGRQSRALYEGFGCGGQRRRQNFSLSHRLNLRTLRECQCRVSCHFTNNYRLLCYDTSAPTTNHLRSLTRAIVETHYDCFRFIAIPRLPDGPGSSFIAPNFSPWDLLT